MLEVKLKRNCYNSFVAVIMKYDFYVSFLFVLVRIIPQYYNPKNIASK